MSTASTVLCTLRQYVLNRNLVDGYDTVVFIPVPTVPVCGASALIAHAGLAVSQAGLTGYSYVQVGTYAIQ